MVITLEFDSLADLESTIKTLRDKYEVTGELHFKPLEGGGWRLKVHSEKPLRDSTIERLPGRWVDMPT